jgi:pimeloyl-ACP methyl ester carboxylesterase
LLLLHGVIQRWQAFLPVIPLLSVHHHICATDFRRHGSSGWRPGQYSFSDDGEDIIRFLREVVAEPVSILGWSMGADVAMPVALQAPELASALVLEDPPLSSLQERDSIVENNEALFRVLRDAMSMDGPDSDKWAALSKIDPKRDETQIRDWYKRLSVFDPTYFDFLTTGQKITSSPYRQLDQTLPGIACPVLLIRGDPSNGGSVSDELVETSLSLLPDGAPVKILGAGHNIHADRPNRFSRVVNEFLGSI